MLNNIIMHTRATEFDRANLLAMLQLTIIRRRRSEYCRIISETKGGDYSKIFAEPVFIREIAFSFIFFLSS